MTQENLKTGKTRPVQCKTAHRPSAAPTHIEYPHIAAAAVGTGIAVVAGVCDIGDITEAAAEA